MEENINNKGSGLYVIRRGLSVYESLDIKLSFTIDWYNEKLCDVPPPGFYNPKYDIAHKGFDTERKLKRLINNPCVNHRSTDCNSVSSAQKEKLGTGSKVRTCKEEWAGDVWNEDKREITPRKHPQQAMNYVIAKRTSDA
ncbi:hypothetical protein PV325_004540 [Microctonus aethiopoides]|nr:hypothetical protein PV325_004540 [Microctonus aethiopoides]